MQISGIMNIRTIVLGDEHLLSALVGNERIGAAPVIFREFIAKVAVPNQRPVEEEPTIFSVVGLQSQTEQSSFTEGRIRGNLSGRERSAAVGSLDQE